MTPTVDKTEILERRKRLGLDQYRPVVIPPSPAELEALRLEALRQEQETSEAARLLQAERDAIIARRADFLSGCPLPQRFKPDIAGILVERGIPWRFLFLGRDRYRAETRWLLFKMLFEHGWSASRIAKAFGFNHTTVRHGLIRLGVIVDRAASDPLPRAIDPAPAGRRPLTVDPKGWRMLKRWQEPDVKERNKLLRQSKVTARETGRPVEEIRKEWGLL